MRGSPVVESVGALVVGAAVGVGLLYATGGLHGSGAIAAMEAEKAALTKRLDGDRLERERLAGLQQAYDAEMARRAELAAKAAAEAAVAAAAAKPEAKESFGVLTVKSVREELVVDSGKHRGVRGNSVELPLEKGANRFRINGGQYKIDLSTKADGKAAVQLDVGVNPMAIITAAGERLGTSASGLKVDRKAYRIDFQSPAAGELQLLLSYKK